MVKWLKELHVPKKIKSPLLAAAKKVEKDAWLMFQHQLVTVGIVTLWKEVNVTEIFGDLRRVWYVPTGLYMKIIPLLNIENVHSLLVWRAWGYGVNNQPTDKLLDFFRREAEAPDDEEKVGEKVAGTDLIETHDFEEVAKSVSEDLDKIRKRRVADLCNGKYGMYGTEIKRRKISVHLGRTPKEFMCTKLHIEVLKNTRDKFVTGPAGEISIQQRLNPDILINDLPFDDANNALRISFYKELLSANLEPAQIANICISHYPEFDDLLLETSIPKLFALEVDEFIVREKVEAVRSKASIQQRQSITVLSEIQDNANRERATLSIQRWWRRWLYVRKPERRKAGAVIARSVKHWWRYKNGVQKRIIRKSFTIASNAVLNAVVSNIGESSPDYLAYDDYVEDQKKDYSPSNLKNPPQRGWKFWAGTASLFVVCTAVGLAIALGREVVNNGIEWVALGILHVMTYVRLIKWVKVVQTILLSILSAYLLRELVGNPFLPLLPAIAMFSVATLRHMWPLLALPCVLAYFAYGTVTTPYGAGFLAINIVYPIYSVVTVVAVCVVVVVRVVAVVPVPVVVVPVCVDVVCV